MYVLVILSNMHVFHIFTTLQMSSLTIATILFIVCATLSGLHGYKMWNLIEKLDCLNGNI